MKVLVVKTTPFGKEGITGVISNIVRHLPADYVVDGVAPGSSDGEYAGLFAAHGGKLFGVKRSIKHPFRYIRALAEIIRDGDYDVVHVHGNSHTVVLELLAAKRAKNRNCVVHAHSTSCSSVLLHKLLTPLFSRLCKNRIACGEKAGAFMYGKQKFLVLKNGIECERYAYSEEARRLIRGELTLDGKTVIAHVGAFTENKNQAFIVGLTGILDRGEGGEYACLLIGDGPEFGAVSALIREKGLGDRVLLIGNTDRVPDYLSAADLIVMPSHYEGFPLTLVEEQCSGLPCVVSDTITSDADLTGDVRFLPLSDGADRWAEEIRRLPSSDRAAKSASNIAAVKRAGYDIGEQVAVLCEYYGELVKR
ncbi:MAG: glycosyltransferase [Clostridia bacterium]|nr:glycosyltransferase [Clostridia bacterium]MBR5044427.1 glycosyltransferase [Clostridia bacterium]